MKEKSSGSWIGAVIAAAVLITVLAFGLRERLKTLREEAEYNAFIESVSRLSLEYVRDKYGFEAELPEDESDFNRSQYDMYKEWSGFFLTRFKMKEPGDEGREFFVYTKCDLIGFFGSSDAGRLWVYDDYQHEDIAAAIADEITNAFGVNGYANMELGGKLPYYSGDNLDEILEVLSGQIEAILPAADVYSPAARELLDKLDKNSKISYTFMFFENEEILEEFVEYTNSQTIRSLTQNTWYELYAPYIKYQITDKKTEPEEISLQECGDFKYGYFPPLGLSENGFNVGSVNIYEFEREMFTGTFEREGEGEWVEKSIDKSYLFGEYSYGNICIYYPLDKLLQSGAEVENIGAAWVDHGGRFKTRGIARAQVCGEYAVFTLSGDGQSFMLVDNTGQGEYVPGKNK